MHPQIVSYMYNCTLWQGNQMDSKHRYYQIAAPCCQLQWLHETKHNQVVYYINIVSCLCISSNNNAN